jgi:hypothetical protein
LDFQEFAHVAKVRLKTQLIKVKKPLSFSNVWISRENPRKNEKESG